VTSSKPRLLFLNRSYFPDAEATGQLLTQLCEDLAFQFDVRVISGQPNLNPSQADYVRVGQEVRGGVTIRRVWNSQFAKSSTIGRLANWFSYMLMATLAAIFGPRPDFVIVETDPPFLCLVGAFLRRRFGCQLIVYLQDIHPDLGVALGRVRKGPITWLLRKCFLGVYRRADQVVVLSNDMRQVLVESGVDRRRITKIPNWVDCSKVTSVKSDNRFRAELDLQDKFVVMHSGNLGFCQRLENILDAAEQLLDRPEIAIVLVGDGASRKRLEADAVRRGLKNVRFVDYQPAARLSESLSAADVHIVSVDPRVVGFLMPSKLYGVLASGTPVLAVAPASCELSEIVERESVGYVVGPDEPSALAKRIADLAAFPYHLKEIGERARSLAVDQFDRGISVDAFATLLLDLFQQSVGSQAIVAPKPVSAGSGGQPPKPDKPSVPGTSDLPVEATRR
jgi:colanic acid biosynthesis glycosyl transferase WcaI